MRIGFYVASFFSLFVGYVAVTIKGLYQSLILSIICSSLYKIGPNPSCDAVMNVPDFGYLLLILGLVGILVTAYSDITGSEVSV